jgi:hypothetical protein
MRLLYLEDNKIHKVYKVRNDSVGYPHFLIYVNNVWLWVTGKNIQPLNWKNRIKYLFKKHK